MNKAGLILRGMGMGIAEVIPGVSGGTIAFITGIYHPLLESIKAVDTDLIKSLLRGKFAYAFNKINATFLLFVLLGMFAGLVSGVFFISHFLETAPELVWGVFFSLILASIPLMIKSMNAFAASHLIYFIVAALLAFFITGLTPVTASENLLYVFLGGMLAIVALVLPGISGSFILLLLGLYTLIIPTIKSFLSQPNMEDFKLVAVFGTGCILGLLLFARLISAAFQRYHDSTIAVMSGFMLGSLNKIWPWRNPELLLNKESGETVPYTPDLNLDGEIYKLVVEKNVWPGDYIADPRTLSVLAAAGLVVLVIVIMAKKAPKI